MSPGSEHRPPTVLGRALLSAGRGDGPPASSRKRALELVDAAPLPAPASPRLRRRWLLGALPAAAVLLGVVLLVRAKLGDEPTAPVAEPRLAAPTLAAPAATASAAPIASPSPSAVAATSASASASAVPPPSAVAAKGKPAGPDAGTTATARPPAAGGGACGCAPSDLMCFMRCSQKK